MFIEDQGEAVPVRDRTPEVPEPTPRPKRPKRETLADCPASKARPKADAIVVLAELELT